MLKTLKKCITALCLLLAFAVIFFSNPVETKAAGPSEMTLGKDGIIRWESTSENSSSTGWKFYVKYWKFTITKTLNGKTTTKTVNVYENSAGYSTRTDSWYEGNTEKYHHFFSCPVSNLEKLSGMNLKEGTVVYKANGAMGFRFKLKDGSYSTAWDKTDNGTYDTADEFYDRCEDHEFSNVRQKYKGYHDKSVDNTYFYLTVKGDAGFSSLSGAGWYAFGTKVTATGTTKHGYSSNGDIPVTVKGHQSVTLTSTPWQHTIVYDSAGGSPTPDSFTKVYGQIAFIDGTPPIKPGYTFTGWKSSVTGTIYQPEDEYTHTQNGGTDTLVAQYIENTCTFIFDANGGIGTMDPITKKSTETLALPENGFTYEGDVSFVGWDTDSGKLVATYQPGDTVKVIDIVTALGKQYEKEAEITIYALWDALPRISATDRYIDLVSAQNGFLTEDELFAYASAEDTEDGVIERGEKFYIKDLDLEKYKKLTAETVNPSVSFEETYVAIDSAGNKAEKTITVTVVNTAAQPSDNSSLYNYVRFISLKYLDYPPEDGGLMADSFWRIPENNAYLRRVLSIHRVNPEVRTISFLGLTYSKEVPGTGEWSAPIKQEWHFSQEDIKAVKEYVDEHGLGNSKEPDALKNFLEVFKHCRIH